MVEPATIASSFSGCIASMLSCESRVNYSFLEDASRNSREITHLEYTPVIETQLSPWRKRSRNASHLTRKQIVYHSPESIKLKQPPSQNSERTAKNVSLYQTSHRVLGKIAKQTQSRMVTLEEDNDVAVQRINLSEQRSNSRLPDIMEEEEDIMSIESSNSGRFGHPYCTVYTEKYNNDALMDVSSAFIVSRDSSFDSAESEAWQAREALLPSQVMDRLTLDVLKEHEQKAPQVISSYARDKLAKSVIERKTKWQIARERRAEEKPKLLAATRGTREAPFVMEQYYNRSQQCFEMEREMALADRWQSKTSERRGERLEEQLRVADLDLHRNLQVSGLSPTSSCSKRSMTFEI